MRSTKICSSSAMVVLVLALAAPAQAVDIEVDATAEYQRMLGWETMLRGWEVDKVNDVYDPTWLEQAPVVLDRLVNELGINRVRLEFRSGVENPVDYYTQFLNGDIGYMEMRDHWYEKINDNDDPDVADPAGYQFAEFDYLVENELLPLKQLIEANGEEIYINLCNVDFNATALSGTFEHALNPEEYAELAQMVFDRLRDRYDLTPNGLEIILEPNNTDAWRGPEIGEAIVATVARLQAVGYDPEISAPSAASAADAVPYFNEILAVPGAVEAMTTFSYHRYGTGDFAEIFDVAEEHGLITGMLENTEGDVESFIEDLTVGNVSAWQKFGIAVTTVSNDIAYYRADFADPENPSIALGPDALMLAPYMRFVRRGALRIGATSSEGGYRPLAFVNLNGSYVVVVYAPSSSATLDISGLPAGTYGVRSATNSSGLSDGEDVTTDGGTLSVAVPAGVTAIYDRRALDPPEGGSGQGGAPNATGGAPSAEGGTPSAEGGAPSAEGGSSSAQGGSAGPDAGSPSESGGAASTTGGSDAEAGAEAGGRATGGAQARGGDTSSGGASETAGAAVSEGGAMEPLADDDSGCSCRAAGGNRSTRSGWLLLAALGMALRRCARSPSSGADSPRSARTISRRR